MKKILLLAVLVLAIIELNAHGACLIENLKMKTQCTGGASAINPPAETQVQKEESFKKESENMYQIPTMALPDSYKNNFPMLNQNCMYGTCFPK